MDPYIGVKVLGRLWKLLPNLLGSHMLQITHDSRVSQSVVFRILFNHRIILSPLSLNYWNEVLLRSIPGTFTPLAQYVSILDYVESSVFQLLSKHLVLGHVTYVSVGFEFIAKDLWKLFNQIVK